ncbi:MAG: type II secretion system protein M [Burkholderiaceae bacterium]|jgi:general secretion pathway protein M|nr:type II secretion system protein M [Burkholderiaceae bacterium]
MNLNRSTLRSEQVWLLLAALILIALIAGLATFTLGVHAKAAQTLAQIEPRYARISGLLEKQQQIQQASKALETSLARYVYPSDGDASQIGNQVLQKVRDLASAAGLRVTSSQSQPAKEDNNHPGLDRIAIDLRIEGDWNALQGLLSDLTRQTPAIYQNTLQLTSQGSGWAVNPKAPLTVSGQFDLYVLQAHPTNTATSAQLGAAQGGTSGTFSGTKQGAGL